VENNHTNTEPNVTANPEETGIIAYIGLGANLGDRQGSLKRALKKLDNPPTIKVIRVSALYETAPVGVTDQPEFLNAVAAVETTLPPRELLDVLLHLENQMGRVRTLRWGPRVIDLDLLLYGDAQVALVGLTVPHPRLRERAFVLVPLAEIAPNLALPEDGRTVSELAESLLGDFGSPGNIRRLDFV
jgi:2-amino-4-hydroxy-6-hydroxymethyldihydropteridine diphosphokinase